MRLNALENLLEALNATDNQVCINEAKRIQQELGTSKHFNLHLRNANMTPQMAHILTPALSTLSMTKEHQLSSFSISYNRLIGDQAAIELLNALPPSVRELGMVGCDLGDITATALAKWAAKAPSLTMLCVEGNHFSTKHQNAIKAMGIALGFSAFV